jgi:peptide/nickel transport system permease protein
MATDTETSVDTQRESIDWDELDASALAVGRRTQGFLVALVLLGTAFLYYRFTKYDLIVGAWYIPSRLDWLFLLSLIVFVFYVIVPLATHRERTLRYWRRFRQNRLAVACLAYLIVFFVLGTASLLFLGRPEIHIQYPYQPPVLFSVPIPSVVTDCAGMMTGTEFQQSCQGSLRFPLGTADLGRSVLGLVVAGMGVSLLVALVTSMLIVPIATTVGIVAGYFGGRVDDVLMRYVDVQQVVPAFLVYVLLSIAYGSSLFLIILAFGLLGWGGVARLVRSEVKQRRSELYITAAESAGASRLQLVRKHILPNVSSTVLTATTRQIPLLILAEAAISFVASLGDENVPSWGQMISNLDMTTWWLWVFPLLLLVITVFSFSVVGDALRDTLDPRGET